MGTIHATTLWRLRSGHTSAVLVSQAVSVRMWREKKKGGRARRSQKRLNTHNSNRLRRKAFRYIFFLIFMLVVDVWRAPKLVRVCLTGTGVVTTRVHVDPATRTRVGGWLFPYRSQMAAQHCCKQMERDASSAAAAAVAAAATPVAAAPAHSTSGAAADAAAALLPLLLPPPHPPSPSLPPSRRSRASPLQRSCCCSRSASDTGGARPHALDGAAGAGARPPVGVHADRTADRGADAGLCQGAAGARSASDAAQRSPCLPVCLPTRLAACPPACSRAHSRARLSQCLPSLRLSVGLLRARKVAQVARPVGVGPLPAAASGRCRSLPPGKKKH